MPGPIWKVKPPLDVPIAGVWLGPGAFKATDGVWLGTLAENVASKTPNVWVTTGKEQVVGLFGKRGSGKSFTLGTLLEGLALKSDAPHVARASRRKAALLFDPLDIYWTTRFPVTSSANAEVRGHFDLAKAWKLAGLEFDVEAWVPGESSKRPSDPAWFKPLTIAVSDLGVDEWSALLDVSVISDPMGQALVELITLVSDTGYSGTGGKEVPPLKAYGLPDLAKAAESTNATSTFHAETLRALRQRLSSLHATGLFGAIGHAIGAILRPGCLSVIMLARLPAAYRAAIVGVLTRQLMEQRAAVAFAEKRLVLDPSLQPAERMILEAVVESGVPRTVVALDEAQTFLAPGGGSPTRDVFIRLVKEGRNFGLSVIVATQQPAAIDRRILSQIETFVAHQLVTSADIDAVVANLKSAIPDVIEFGNLALSFADMLRMLSPGQCIVSAADMNTTLRRSVAVNVRPRATVHGGIEL
jgi:DNA helicase HerA-like ATPase